jgi:hypothetical protein
VCVRGVGFRGLIGFRLQGEVLGGGLLCLDAVTRYVAIFNLPTDTGSCDNSKDPSTRTECALNKWPIMRACLGDLRY